MQKLLTSCITKKSSKAGGLNFNNLLVDSMPDENPNNGQDEENTAQEQLQTPEQEQYEYEQLPSETTEIDENSEETK